MAKIDLKFLDVENDNKLSVYCYEEKEISISIVSDNTLETIYLDKSTAIKFAKTLRTEINKIQD